MRPGRSSVIPTRTSCPGTDETPSSNALNEMWRRQAIFWHGLLAALLVVQSAIVIVTGGPHVAVRVALVTLLAVAYVAWGVRGLAQDRRAGLIYLTLAWSTFLALAVAGGPDNTPWLLSFALFPQTWAMLERNQAAGVIALGVALIAVLRLVQSGTDGDALVEIGVTSVISIALSLGLGLFIHRLISEAEARAESLDRLQQTQSRLSAAERARGIAEERARLSREIHDTLAQGFTSVVTLARATEAAVERGDLDTVRERLALIEATASDNLAEARLIVAEMTPGHLQSRSLAQALERLVGAMSAESGVAGTARIIGDPRLLPATTEVVLLRSAQEALANVRRHALATTFELTLDYGERVRLEVADDGIGFAAGRARGYGLDGAEARAGEIGADFSVESTPGAGTRLRVVVPG